MKKHILHWAGASVLTLALLLAMLLSMGAAGTLPDPDAADSGTAESTSPPPTETQEPDIAFAGGDIYWRYGDAESWTLELYGVGDDAEVTWTVSRKSGQTGTKLPTIGGVSEESADGTIVYKGTGRTARLVSRGAGEFTVTAEYGGRSVRKNVTISGIVLSGTRLDPKTDSVTMFVNDNTTLIYTAYGYAVDSTTRVIWGTSDSSVVSVMYDAGSLTAYKLGTAVITATKGDYSTECTVKVEEDKSVIADEGYTASASKPLNIGQTVYTRLNAICEDKTKERSDPPTASPLRYINNLSVSTDQGTLYYNYVAESDTGDGVGTADQFAKPASGAIKSADKLYFVPKSGFVGTAEITFQGVAVSGFNFSGTIKVKVGVGSVGEDGKYDENGEYTYQISYRTRAGEPAWFMVSDFNAFCQSATGRGFSSVTFSLPRPSEGVLYYNYRAGTGTPVTTTTRFTPSGVYTLDNVCFVPSATYNSDDPVTIKFQAVDSSGETTSGTVEVTVIPVDISGEPSNVAVFGEKGQPVTLQGELFNDACRGTIQDTLSFVIFKLPDPKEGVLYYNYRSNGSFDSRVTATTRCYYSGVPGLSGVTFVPGSGASGRIAIPYTGYGSTGTSFSGTLYISLDEVNSSTIRYSVEKNGMVTFRASDFYNAGLYQKGVGADRVEIKKVSMSKTGLGTLRYNYQSSSKPGSAVSSGTYYVSPNSGQRGLNLLSFHAAGSTGTVTIDYEASCGTGSDQKTFTGQVVIQVGAIAAADVNVYCNTGGQAGLPSYSLSGVCSPVMGESLSYIEITSVPASEAGHLYFGYSRFGTGTVVKPGNRFYYAGSPSIDQLKFVPRAGFTGEAEITYIGYSDDGSKQTSGRVKVSVSRSTSSYFNDMSGHVWAIDSVNYLYQNGTVEGIGDGRYNPAGTIIKGDFTLMLVRAYGLTASGSASFNDVPADSYYADAIRIAALLGVAGGTNGNYNPQTALSRQDAMLMIFNALKASGKIVTNGLAADLSAFYDERDIAPYAKEAVGCLVQMGVVEGDGNGYLRPMSQLNRAETAKLLHAIMTL